MEALQHQFRILVETDLNKLVNETTNLTLLNSTNLLPSDYVWGLGIATAFGYLAFSFLLALIVVSYSKKVTQKKLNFMIASLIALAIGSLLGDAVIHIIPEVYGVEENEGAKKSKHEKPNKNISSLMILLGFFLFFTLGKIFIFSGCGHTHGVHNHENHNHFDELKEISSETDNKTKRGNYSKNKLIYITFFVRHFFRRGNHK